MCPAPVPRTDCPLGRSAGSEYRTEDINNKIFVRG